MIHTKKGKHTTKLDLSGSPEDVIKRLKTKSVVIPSWEELVKSYDQNKHDIITDKTIFVDKVRGNGTIDKQARISIALEKLAVKRMAEFCFSIPVKRRYIGVDDRPELKKEIIKAIEAVYKGVRIDTQNLERARKLFASCEVCTIWYTAERPHSSYGFESPYKFRCRSYSPIDGYELYPLFDSSGDMIAMSIGYSMRQGDNMVEYFETYTDSEWMKWSKGGSGWETLEHTQHNLGKIPVSYAYRSEPIYSDITEMRHDMELLVSRNSNVIAYNSAPVLKVVGELVGSEERNSPNRIFRVENNGDVGYVSWDQSVESIRTHHEILRANIFMLLQLPDLSFESVKSLGAIGFDARQTLLADAHLKVGDESGTLVEMLEREANVIKSLLMLARPDWSDALGMLDVEHIITPFIQGDERAEIQKRLLANGGKPIESQRESIERHGESLDPDRTLEQIRQELTDMAEIDRHGDITAGF